MKKSLFVIVNLWCISAIMCGSASAENLDCGVLKVYNNGEYVGCWVDGRDVVNQYIDEELCDCNCQSNLRWGGQPYITASTLYESNVLIDLDDGICQLTNDPVTNAPSFDLSWLLIGF